MSIHRLNNFFNMRFINIIKNNIIMILGIKLFLLTCRTFSSQTTYSLTCKVKGILCFSKGKSFFLYRLLDFTFILLFFPDLKDARNIIGFSIDFKGIFG